ncbi:MAG: Holliday junction resolvase RuvX [Planctomycetota bacterium]|nr:MAG: Holliday junction resolvase RuvX [Planctomycetota bacterium]
MATARFIGIDYGVRRIGVAVADAETRIAVPLATLNGRNDVTRDARAMADLGEREAAGSFVVGLPLNMDGSDSLQTTLTRRFAAELERLSGRPVHLHDERLSSFAAEGVMDEAGVRTRDRKGLADRIAAQKILQAFLDAGS